MIVSSEEHPEKTPRQGDVILDNRVIVLSEEYYKEIESLRNQLFSSQQESQLPYRARREESAAEKEKREDEVTTNNKSSCRTRGSYI